MAIRLPLMTLAALSAVAAAPALATSPAQTARTLETSVEPAAIADGSESLPDSPLAIAVQLAARDTGLQIELGASEPAARAADLLEVPVDISSQEISSQEN